jgi:hypothetical protein
MPEKFWYKHKQMEILKLHIFHMFFLIDCEYRVMVMFLNTAFNNISVISWRSVLLVEETGIPVENHRPVASHWQTLSHSVVSSTPWTGFELTMLVMTGIDCIGSCKSNYHTITTTMATDCKYMWSTILILLNLS